MINFLHRLLLECITCGKSDLSIGNPALAGFDVQFIDVSEDSEHFPHYAYILILVSGWLQLHEHTKMEGTLGMGFYPTSTNSFGHNPSLPCLWPEVNTTGMVYC